MSHSFSRDSFRRLARPLVVCLGLSLGLLSGCGGGSGSKPTPGPNSEAAKLFPGPASDPARGVEAGSTWTIAIVGVKDNKAMATAALEKVQTKAGLRQAYLDQRGNTFVVAYGSYPGPSDPAAQADLKRIRTFEFEGGTPFAGAVLSPPEVSAHAGSIPELDLLSIKNDPLSLAKYTLQVGVYGRVDQQPPSASDLEQFRKAAEDAAVRLRREGDEAYYYHGPTRSMVLIGAFEEGEYDRKNHGLDDSPKLKAAREKFPYNLVNGAGYKETPLGKTEGKLQASRVVEIPR